MVNVLHAQVGNIYTMGHVIIVIFLVAKSAQILILVPNVNLVLNLLELNVNKHVLKELTALLERTSLYVTLLLVYARLVLLIMSANSKGMLSIVIMGGVPIVVVIQNALIKLSLIAIRVSARDVKLFQNVAH